MFSGSSVEGREVQLEGLTTPGIIHKDGLLLTGKDKKKVRLTKFIKSLQHTVMIP